MRRNRELTVQRRAVPTPKQGKEERSQLAHHWEREGEKQGEGGRKGEGNGRKEVGEPKRT